MLNVNVNDKLSPEQICKRILMVKKMQASGDPKFREYHDTVFNDGIWKIDLEVFAVSGVIRFWVSREDKYGHYQNSQFTMYRADNGQMRYFADYQIKKDIVNRLLKTYEYMEKAGIAE